MGVIMAKISFQFHATREETSTFISDKIKENKLMVVSLHTFPFFEYKVIDSSSISDDQICGSEMILLYMNQHINKASNYIEFLRNNSGFLCIRLGAQDDKILRESFISGTADNEDLKLWRIIINQYKKTMHKGAWIIGGYNKKKKYYKDHRYTDMAKKMYENGITIMGMGGDNTYVLESSVEC